MTATRGLKSIHDFYHDLSNKLWKDYQGTDSNALVTENIQPLMAKLATREMKNCINTNESIRDYLVARITAQVNITLTGTERDNYLRRDEVDNELLLLKSADSIPALLRYLHEYFRLLRINFDGITQIGRAHV